VTGQPVQVGITLTAAQYRALVAIADRKQTNARQLIEGLVATALLPKAERAAEPAATIKPGFRYARVSQEHLDEIVSLSKLGYSDAEIARRLKLGRSTIQTHRSRAELPSVGRGRPKKHTRQENPA
jgi:DNA-binding NarL/FixJ family response regulator